MKNALLAAICLALTFISCEENISPDSFFNLEDAYLNNSTTQLDKYFEVWAKGTNPITQEELSGYSDTVKSVYEIYKKFYDPFNVNKYFGENSHRGKITEYYDGVDNIIVQEEISYRMEGDYKNTYKINNFRPDISFPNKRIVRMNEEKQKELIDFLEKSEYRDESQKRLKFLNSKTKVFPGHWWGWELETSPYVSHITFNSSLDTAIVRFGIVNFGGETKFIRNSGEWKWHSSSVYLVTDRH